MAIIEFLKFVDDKFMRKLKFECNKSQQLMKQILHLLMSITISNSVINC